MDFEPEEATDPTAYLKDLIETLVTDMTTSRKEFDQTLQDTCLNVCEETENLSLLKSHFNEAFPSLAAQSFTSLQIHTNECSFRHSIRAYVPSPIISLKPLTSFEEALSDCFKVRDRITHRCERCYRDVSLEQTRKLGVLPKTLVLNVELFDVQGAKSKVHWKIPPYHIFKQYLYRDLEK